MGIWSDFFDPFSSVQSDRARQAKADARARGRAAYQASAEAVRDGVNRACEVESAMGTATEPDRELEQANKEIRAFARRAGSMFWRDMAWEQGIGIERAYGNYHDKRGFPFGWGNLPQEEKDKLLSDYEKSRQYWRSKDYPQYREKFWKGVDFRISKNADEQTQQTLADITAWRDGIEADYHDVQARGETLMQRRAAAVASERAGTGDKESIRDIDRELLEQKRDAVMIYKSRDMVAEDYVRVLEGYEHVVEDKEQKAAEKAREEARAIAGPEEVRRIRTEIAHRTRDMMIIHNDELKDMNNRLHAQGVRACVLGGMPNRTRLVFEDRVTLRDKIDAKINCQDLDFGD